MQALAAAAAAQAGPDWLELSAVPRVGPTTRDRLLEFGFVGEAEGSEVGTGRRPTTAQRANLIAHYGDEAAVEAAVARARDQRPGDPYRVFADDGEIGPVATDSLIAFFAEPHNADAVNALLGEVKTEPMAVAATATAFAGKTLVFTAPWSA